MAYLLYEKVVSVRLYANSQNDSAAFTLNDISQLICFASCSARGPRQTKDSYYYLPAIFRNFKAKKKVTPLPVTWPTFKKTQVC